MNKVHLFIISYLAIVFIGLHLQAEDTLLNQEELVRFIRKAPNLSARITTIKKITDEKLLQKILCTRYRKDDRHIKNAVGIQLLLLDPRIVQYYGKLQFHYHLFQTIQKYGGTCTLYIDHLETTIIDSDEKTIKTYSFHGASGKTYEKFKMIDGVCQPKTNKVRVDLSKIRRDLLEELNIGYNSPHVANSPCESEDN
jgi:hypothetical protein